MSIFRFAFASVLSLLVIGTTVAQNPQPLPVPSSPPAQPSPQNRVQPAPQQQPIQNQQSQQTTANKPSTSSSSDQMIATMLLLGNQKESRLGAIAKKHSDNAKVKEFAEMMIRDHDEMSQTLQKFGTRPGLSSASSDRQDDRVATTTASPATQQAANAAAGQPMLAGGLDVLSIKRQIAEKCLSEAEQEWSAKKSAECDMGYIGQQMVAHKEMIVSAKVLRQYASPELQKTIDDGVQTAESHLKEAKKLIETLAEEEHKTAKSE